MHHCNCSSYHISSYCQQTLVYAYGACRVFELHYKAVRLWTVLDTFLLCLIKKKKNGSSFQVSPVFVVYLSVAPTIDLPVSPFSVCMLLCKHAACIIRLERGSHWGRDNTLASHGCCKAQSRDRSALHKGLCE